MLQIFRCVFVSGSAILISSALCVLVGCEPGALRDHAGPAQASHNLAQIRLAMINFWNDHQSLPTPRESTSWRLLVAPYLDDAWRTGGGNAMPEVFRIPTTCSHSVTGTTNVYLVTMEDDSVGSVSWEAFEEQHPNRPLLILLENHCEDWKDEGTLGLEAIGEKGNLIPTNGKLWKGGGTLVFVNGEIQHFNPIAQASSNQ